MSSFTPIFKERLLKMIDKQASQKWWENVLYSFTDEQEKDIYTIDVDGRFWAEIDCFDDYDRILNYVDIIKKKEHRIYNPKN